MKLNYKIPSEALQIIDHLVSNNETIQMSIKNCRVFDACMQTIKKNIDEQEATKKEKQQK